MRKSDIRRILEMFQNTDPLLRRGIVSQAKRYESLDDFLLDIYDILNEEKRKQKRIDGLHYMNILPSLQRPENELMR